jgi:hypothetical protein
MSLGLPFGASWLIGYIIAIMGFLEFKGCKIYGNQRRLQIALPNIKS